MIKVTVHTYEVEPQIFEVENDDYSVDIVTGNALRVRMPWTTVTYNANDWSRVEVMKVDET